MTGEWGMGKYDPLRDFLALRKDEEFFLSFNDIEEIIGGPLPPSAQRPQWWENSSDDNSRVQREAWRVAGYDAFKIAGSDRVKFRKVAQ